uniref:T6SS phospholipase effector Tle1-like catalytic domain-containing protein n=1 Tax=Azonexus sp. TaxID=1872668 RepID=UPI0035ADCDB0
VHSHAKRYLALLLLLLWTELAGVFFIHANIIPQTPYIFAGLIKGLPDQLTKALQERKGGKKACQINISVFGFSRGAAQARVFVNWLFEICKYNKGKKQWTLAGIPINLQFLGIFDTVASVGIANISKKTINTGHYSWANKKALKIHPAVKRCVHFVAGHEIRACFPLDSIWRDAKMRPKTLIEVMYPGSHSDVGGGYAPGELGVSLSANSLISIIPGRNMHAHAGNAGVPLKINAYYKSDLIPSDKTLQHFKAYMDATDTKGTVKEAGRKHMAYYFSYRFKYRSQFKTLPFYKNTKNKKQLRDLEINQKHFIARLTTLLPPLLHWSHASNTKKQKWC